MARTIQHKRGLEKNLPTLKPGELAFTTDTKKVYIGSDTGNVDITSNVDTSKLATKTELSTVTSQLADKAQKTEVEIERNRIDNLVSLGNGVDNAETADIRVATDGKVYPSAGASVREQVKQSMKFAEDNVAKLTGGVFYENFTDKVEWLRGYVGETGAISTTITNGESYSKDALAVKPNTTCEIRYVRNHAGRYGWITISEYDSSGKMIKRTTYDEYNGQFPEVVQEDGKTVAYFNHVTSANAQSIRVSIRTWLFSQNSTEEQILNALPNVKNLIRLQAKTTYPQRILPNPTSADEGSVLVLNKGAWVKKPLSASVNPSIKSINHRGYNTIAPENTLSAFRLSKKMGFDIVEADISFTSDGHAVLLHDETVDRTSNGTGSIGELTLEHVRTLDFGSWKSSDYAGEKIPTFEEFISFCRKIGLYPYIELKYPITQSQIEGLVITVKRYGMANKVTWITSNGVQYLRYVQNVHAPSRLGLVVSTIRESHITEALTLKNDMNEVFIDALSQELTNEMVNLCIENNIPIEVWDLWSEKQIKEANPYISGFTTDTIVAGVVLYKSEQ